LNFIFLLNILVSFSMCLWILPTFYPYSIIKFVFVAHLGTYLCTYSMWLIVFWPKSIFTQCHRKTDVLLPVRPTMVFIGQFFLLVFLPSSILSESPSLWRPKMIILDVMHNIRSDRKSLPLSLYYLFLIKALRHCFFTLKFTACWLNISMTLSIYGGADQCCVFQESHEKTGGGLASKRKEWEEGQSSKVENKRSSRADMTLIEEGRVKSRLNKYERWNINICYILSNFTIFYYKIRRNRCILLKIGTKIERNLFCTKYATIFIQTFKFVFQIYLIYIYFCIRSLSCDIKSILII